MSEYEADKVRENLLSQLRAVSIDGLRLSEYADWEMRIASILDGLSDDDVAGMLSRITASLGDGGDPISLFAVEFGLTPSELLLVESIADGLSVPEHADKQGISVNTARVHMQRVLDKTGARRQTDLLRMLYRR